MQNVTEYPTYFTAILPSLSFNYFMAMPFMSNIVIPKFITIKTLLHVTSYFYTHIYFYIYVIVTLC